MLWLTVSALVIATACSGLSKSALQWSAIMGFGIAMGFGLGSLEFHRSIFVADVAILVCMALKRQELNDWWQESVIALQIVISLAYLTYAVFAGSVPWLTALIDYANVLFLAQVALVGSGGIKNGYQNIKRLKQQRKSGRNVPISTIWKMI